MKRIRPDDYTLKQLSETKFLIEHRNGKKYPILVTEKGTFEGIPSEISKPINSFTPSEILKNPLSVLQAAIKEREELQPNKQFEENVEDGFILPSEFEAKQMLQFTLKKEDPSLYYDVLGRIGEGANSRVFQVSRKADE